MFGPEWEVTFGYSDLAGPLGSTPDSQISSLSACLCQPSASWPFCRRNLGELSEGMFSNRAMTGEPDADWRGERQRERERLEVLCLSPDPSVRLPVRPSIHGRSRGRRGRLHTELGRKMWRARWDSNPRPTALHAPRRRVEGSAQRSAERTSAEPLLRRSIRAELRAPLAI